MHTELSDDSFNEESMYTKENRRVDENENL